MADNSKICKSCQKTFTELSNYRKHIRSCSKTVVGLWANGEFTVTSGTDGRFTCCCTNPRCMRVYQSLDGFKGHVSAQYVWCDPKNTDGITVSGGRKAAAELQPELPDAVLQSDVDPCGNLHWVGQQKAKGDLEKGKEMQAADSIRDDAGWALHSSADYTSTPAGVDAVIDGRAEEIRLSEERDVVVGSMDLSLAVKNGGNVAGSTESFVTTSEGTLSASSRLSLYSSSSSAELRAEREFARQLKENAEDRADVEDGSNVERGPLALDRVRSLQMLKRMVMIHKARTSKPAIDEAATAISLQRCKTNADLGRLHVSYNPEYRFLVCDDCHIALEPSFVQAHLKHRHVGAQLHVDAGALSAAVRALDIKLSLPISIILALSPLGSGARWREVGARAATAHST